MREKELIETDAHKIQDNRTHTVQANRQTKRTKHNYVGTALRIERAQDRQVEDQAQGWKHNAVKQKVCPRQICIQELYGAHQHHSDRQANWA